MLFEDLILNSYIPWYTVYVQIYLFINNCNSGIGYDEYNVSFSIIYRQDFSCTIDMNVCREEGYLVSLFSIFHSIRIPHCQTLVQTRRYITVFCYPPKLRLVRAKGLSWWFIMSPAQFSCKEQRHVSMTSGEKVNQILDLTAARNSVHRCLFVTFTLN